MARWPRGQAVIEQLLTSGALSSVDRSASDGLALLAQAQRRLRIAEAGLEIDAGGAYTNAYDAARLVGTALAAQQGLRPTTQGGHSVVEEVIVTQFGPGFARFGVLRRRRHELDYPGSAYTGASRSEASEAAETVQAFVKAAEQLLEQLGFFAQT